MRRMRRPASASRTNRALRAAIRQLLDHRNLTVSVLAGSLLLVSTQPASALGLGELRIDSRLGQRLSASVPVRLDPGESLRDGCVLPAFGSRATAGSGLATVPGVAVATPDASRAGTYELQVSSTAALYEPMYALELRINCPGVPGMVRQFVLMLDLPGAVAAAGTATPAASIAPVRLPASSRPASTTVRPAATARARLEPTAAPIAAGSRYRVARGDTLSSIAARVTDRQVSLWVFAGAIQAANPEAFIHGDANLIKLGSEIVIPAAATGLPTTIPAAPAPAPAAVPTVAPAPAPAPVTAAPATAAPAAPASLTAAPAATTPAKATPAAASPVAATPVAVAPITMPRPDTAPANSTTVPGTPAAPAAGPDPFLAAGAGILFGLLVSLLLWLRNRLPARRQSAALPLANRDQAADRPAATDALATIPVVVDHRSEEPGFTVSWSEGPADDLLAAEFADAPTEVFDPPAADATDPGPLLADAGDTGDQALEPATLAHVDITSELEELFDSTDTTIQKRLDAEKNADEPAAARAASDNEQTVSVDALDPADGLLSGHTVDFLIGELRAGDDAADGSSTVEQPRPAPGSQPARQEPVDIHALAAQISTDNQQAQTLLEALSLLERDYENELTASQVLDLSAMRNALGDDNDEPTQVRETQISERRRKAR